MKSPDHKLFPFIGYFVAILFLGFSVFIFSRNLILKSRLDEVRLEYENLLSDKLQLERSYYRLKEGRLQDTNSATYLKTAAQFNDSLKAMKRHQQEELARLYRKIEELRLQIRKN